MKDILLEELIINQANQEISHLVRNLNVNYPIPKGRLLNKCPELQE
jgi:hypothetical protein